MKKKMQFSWDFTPGFFLALFWIAFGIGVVAVNCLWEPYFQQGNILGIFILFQSTMGNLEPAEYFIYVLRYHGSWLLICLLASFSIWGVPIAVLSILIMGSVLGIVLTLSILQFGILGILCGAALFLPQILCYFPAAVCMMSRLAQKSYGSTKKGDKKAREQRIGRKVLGGCFLAYLTGMILESCVNPILLEFVLSRLSIF